MVGNNVGNKQSTAHMNCHADVAFGSAQPCTRMDVPWAMPRHRCWRPAALPACRYFANASVSGTMSVTSCGYTTGDSVVAVIAAPSLTGPYSCAM